MIKNLILILLIVSISGCASRWFVKDEEKSPTPTPKPQITVVDEDTAKFNQRFYEDLKPRLKKSAADKGLYSSAEASLPKDAIEVRLSMFADFYGPELQGLFGAGKRAGLKKDAGGWSAKIIRDVLKNDNKKEKMTETLAQPASGWDNLWQQLQSEGILNKTEKAEAEIKTSSRLFVIDSKVNGTYNYVYFHQPKENSGIPEEARIAKLFNLIGKEFNVSDIKAS